MQRVLIHTTGGAIELEAELIGAGPRLMVFLHEGLGSLAGWGGWPRALREAAGCRGLVFSRYGYGRSQRRPPQQAWPSDYLGIEAREHLPARAGLPAGGRGRHRAGAAPVRRTDRARQDRTIAAGMAGWPAARQAGVAARRSGRRVHGVERLLGGRRRSSSGTSAQPAAIRCPTLAVQGTLDQYGSLDQLAELRRRVPHAELLVLDGCRHIPHDERPQAVHDAVAEFLVRLP